MLDTVSQALAGWSQPKAAGHRVIVPTNCLFAGGGIIRVIVEGGQNTFVVHDDGAALADFENAGGDLITATKMMAAHFRQDGFLVDGNGVISAPPVSLDALAPTIALVANASRSASDHLMARWKPAFRLKFKDAVRNLLEAEYPKRWAHDRTLVGKSNKPHKFDFVIDLGHERQLFFDAVVPEATAINTAVVRHLDVAATHGDKIVQRIVYDDREAWKASDLNLLKLGAPAFPFSVAHQALDRIAA